MSKEQWDRAAGQSSNAQCVKTIILWGSGVMFLDVGVTIFVAQTQAKTNRHEEH